MIVMFGASGFGLAALRTSQNGGKTPRHSLDQWDKLRDVRLTGSKTQQVANATAPAGFELNNPWKLERRMA
ncbi:Conserved hypothetical, protein [Geosmithia morbida]|uniref:NADH dehydrogenase [ubiquinone] 1 alpha subcomplex subunit 1 n=1 Tax=Geosmithia morbida TaxID=1094350 RepID=A0A9P5D1F2_9HYPO|nr:Conserved hypothetical, protein [Geosmithia morbida]KAF4122687.1 Conserved hypothetical, protein [Geosmithia morbida]